MRLLFTGPRGVGKYTLASSLRKPPNCERLPDDAAAECYTCQRIALASPTERLIEQGLANAAESPMLPRGTNAVDPANSPDLGAAAGSRSP